MFDYECRHHGYLYSNNRGSVCFLFQMELIVMMFKDRVDAGRRLAKLLKRYAVDDGVATGYTIKAAVKEIRSKKPKRLVVAVPAIPSDTARDLDRMVDD